MGLKYYYDMKDAPLSGLLRKASLKTENKFIDFSDSSWQDFPDTGIIIGEYIIFYQGRTIDHGAHVPGPVSQSITESEYNSAQNTGMALAYFMMLVHAFLNKDRYIVPEEAPLIILDIKSTVCIAKNGKDTNNTRHMTIRVRLMRNS